MSKKITLTGLIVLMFFLVAVTIAAYGGVGVKGEAGAKGEVGVKEDGEDGEDGEGGGSSHYQGQDCLSCHKGGEHQLLIAGTVFSASNSTAPCAGASLELLNPTTNAVVYATKNYYSEDTNGIGNFFIKRENFSSIAQGSYIAKIISADGILLAQSAAPHAFSGNTNTTDLNNRYSCNLCHTTPPANGAPGPIYAQQNTDKCSNTAAYTPYDGGTLYNQNCAACHNSGANGAQAISGVAGRGDDVSIAKNAISTNKSRAGVTTNMNVYSFLSDNQLQAIVNYTYPLSETMTVPNGQFSLSFNAAETPVISASSADAAPIGVGSLSGGFFNWQVGLPAFSGSVDIIVAIQSGSSTYFVASDNTLTQNLSIWKTVSGAKVNESITENLGVSGGNFPTSSLPAGTYTFYVAVLPAGNLGAGNVSAYYLWETQFTL